MSTYEQALIEVRVAKRAKKIYERAMSVVPGHVPWDKLDMRYERDRAALKRAYYAARKSLRR